MADLKKFPKLDFKTLSAYTSPQAFSDLNTFLEKLPQNAGKTVLIAAAIAWTLVAVLGLFTTIKAQDLNNLRAQLQDAKALMPIVPVMSEVPVDQGTVDDVVKRLGELYKGLEIRNVRSEVAINGAGTNLFSSFREAVLQLQNSGQGWKVGLAKMCVGRECPQKQLSITLKVARINIDKPESSQTTYLPGSAPKPTTE